MELPPSWQFLGPMWWVLHIVAIALVFYIGYAVGKSSGGGADDAPPPGPWHGREDDNDGKDG